MLIRLAFSAQLITAVAVAAIFPALEKELNVFVVQVEGSQLCI